MLKMKDRVKSIELIGSHRDLFYWVRVIACAVLAVVLSYIITSAFELPRSIRYLIMAILCIITSLISSLRPRLFLRLICFLIFSIGVSLLFLANNKELIGLLGWDPGLLGAGASIVALAVAFYGLIVQREQEKETVKVNGGEMRISGLQKGYEWLEDRKKYRCEYCKRSGRYHYCKTLSGIKGHIARKHVQRKI
jgi:hypothetical protein